MLHDPIHKLLCSFPRVVADILRGYFGGELVRELDFRTLEQVATEQVADSLERRLSDAVWRVRRADRSWVWVYLLLEFQSRPDPGMSLRMLVYVGLQYLDLQRKLGSREPVPPVLGCVLYNGEEEWVEELDTRSRVALEKGTSWEPQLPNQRFPVIDERREGQREGPRGNVAWLLFRLWGLEQGEELLDLVRQVRTRLGGEADRELRAAFERVIEQEVIPAYYPRGSQMRDARGLATIETMLRGNVVPFAKRYESHGLKRGLRQGIDQGIEQGLEAVRSVHVTTAFVRFGDPVAERLAELLRSVRDLQLLQEVAEIAIRARTGDELLLQVAALLEAGPSNGGRPE